TKVEKKEEKKGGCFCKQEENQFYWSDKLTCDQRKKVLEVCQELWGEKNKKEKASQLMSIMYIETNKTFSPSADNGIGFSGLIQFNDAAAKGVGTTRAELKKMTFIKQMDYVKAYFMKRKDELNTMTDMYLLVMKPSAVGKGNDSNYAVFDESISVPDGDGSKTNAAQRQININREPWVTKYGYSSNPKFLTEKGEKEKRKKWVYTRQKYESRPGFIGGKTTIKEIEQVLKDEGFYLGKNHIFKGKCIDEKEIISNNKERAPWVDVAFEEFEKYKGITEKESPLKERISEYFKLSGSPSLTYKDAWCATFVHWCFQHTEYKDTNEKGNVGAFDWAEEGNLRIKGNSTKDGWINGEKSEVFVGAVIVFSFSHVAIIVGENKTGEKYIYLGGNQGSKVTGGQKICMGSVSKNSKDIFAIMKPKNYNPKENEKKLPIYDVEEENSNSSSR
ncbi:CHAP domain-containing protein, partial [Flavobacterium columnare]